LTYAQFGEGIKRIRYFLKRKIPRQNFQCFDSATAMPAVKIERASRKDFACFLAVLGYNNNWMLDTRYLMLDTYDRIQETENRTQKEILSTKS